MNAAEIIAEGGICAIHLRRRWHHGRILSQLAHRPVHAAHRLAGRSAAILVEPVHALFHEAETVEDHAVIIEKERPLLLAGLRPQTYRVFVDGKLVLERSGV
jgi:hypothetical protein